MGTVFTQVNDVENINRNKTWYLNYKKKHKKVTEN